MTASAVTASTARGEHAERAARTTASHRAATAWAWAWALAAVFFALYATLSVRDQQLQRTAGFDLGIFDEAVRAYAHGRAPIVPLKGPDFDLLGDHFSPIWATLAPVYRIFPTAYTLLLAQAALLALAVVPLVRWAGREVGIVAGIVVSVGYGTSWGIASAAGFDVHEVAFTVPMLSYCTVAWALPLLLVKEDLGLTVAAVGCTSRSTARAVSAWPRPRSARWARGSKWTCSFRPRTTAGTATPAAWPAPSSIRAGQDSRTPHSASSPRRSS